MDRRRSAATPARANRDETDPTRRGRFLWDRWACPVRAAASAFASLYSPCRGNFPTLARRRGTAKFEAACPMPRQRIYLQPFDPINDLPPTRDRRGEMAGKDFEIFALGIFGERVEGVFRSAAVDRIELADDPEQRHRRGCGTDNRGIFWNHRRPVRVEPAQINHRRCSRGEWNALRHIRKAVRHVALARSDQALGARHAVADKTAHVIDLGQMAGSECDHPREPRMARRITDRGIGTE